MSDSLSSCVAWQFGCVTLFRDQCGYVLGYAFRMRRYLALAFVVMSACARENALPQSVPVRDAEATIPSAMPAVTPSASVTTSSSASKPMKSLHEQVGQSVEVLGRISDTPWQHMMGSVPGKPHALYFDLAAGGAQTVLYSADLIRCKGDVLVKGTVIEVSGAGKRDPARKEPLHREFHIDVTSWECR
jgi:hypothetical protein